MHASQVLFLHNTAADCNRELRSLSQCSVGDQRQLGHRSVHASSSEVRSQCSQALDGSRVAKALQAQDFGQGAIPGAACVFVRQQQQHQQPCAQKGEAW